MNPMPWSGRIFAGLLVVAAALLAAAQQCPELIQDDVSLLQSVMAVSGAHRARNVRPASLRPMSLESDEQHPVEAMASEGESVQHEGHVLPPWPFRLGSAEGFQAWWTKRPRPWLSCHVLLGTWAVLVNVFILWQLIAVAPGCLWAASCEGTPAGQAAVTKDVAVPRKTDVTKESAAPEKEAQQHHGMSLSMNGLDSNPAGQESLAALCQPAGGADEHLKVKARFQECWTNEVKSRGLKNASLGRVLANVIGQGWWTVGLLLMLGTAIFSVNSFGMILAAQWLLAYVEWLRVQHGGLVVPDPFYSCFAVLVLCFVMPVSGILLDLLLKAKDEQISAQLAAALAAASGESPDGVRESVADVARDAVRLGIQCVVAPVGIVALLFLLWMKVGISALIVVAGFILLVLVTLRILSSIVQPRVAHQVASQRRLNLLRSMLGALRVVRCHAWEEPLMKRVAEARSEELDAAWSIQHAVSLVAALGATWPRLVTLAVLTGYSMFNPAFDGQAVFLCLQVMSCITCQISTLSQGFSKVGALGQAVDKLESILKLPNMKFGGDPQLSDKQLLKQAPQPNANRNGPAEGSFEDSGNRQVEAETMKSCFGLETLLYYIGIAGWSRVCVLVSLIFAAQASMLLMDNSLGQWSDEAVVSYKLQDSRPASCTWLQIYALFWLCCIGLSSAANVAGVSFSRSFSQAVHWHLVKSVLFAPTDRFYQKQHAGEMMKNLSADMSEVDLNLWSKMAGLVSMACAIVCPMAYVHFVMPYYFTLLVLPCYIAMGTFARAFFKALLQPDSQSTRMHSSAVRWLLLRCVACFACIYAVAGILIVLEPEVLSFGDFGLVVVFCTLVLPSLEVTVDQCIGFKRELAAVQRLREAVPELPAKSLEDRDTPPPPGWLADGAHVEIRSLSVGYGEEADVLRGIVLEVGRHQKVGIVGAAGSGKSTLLLALLRAVDPRQGKILLDGASVTQVGLRPLRLSLGFLTQEPLLFQGSIRFNLDPFSHYSNEELTTVLRQVGLERFSQDSDRGLNAEVGAAAAGPLSRLSSAELHLLGVARLLLRQPSLLLLDEVFSPSLDKHANAMLRRTVHSEFPRSTIIATSRQSDSFIGFDRVVTLKGGQLLECSS
mmetsp:Transcript_86221/g.150458  ORF Transcript_86221/g.150458 Transcript_86221/m.150458 type:complete len:1118 (+) Transcript_86221:53-3406(+)